MFKSRYLASLILIFSAFNATAWAVTADELKTQVVDAIKVPFGLTMVGGVKNADVTVTGDGPYRVEVSGGTLADAEFTGLSMTVEALENGDLKISDVAFTDALTIDYGPIQAKVKGLDWSGVWSPLIGDYTELDMKLMSMGLAVNLPSIASGQIVIEDSTQKVSAWDSATKKTSIASSIAMMTMELDIAGQQIQRQTFSNLKSGQVIVSQEPVKPLKLASLTAQAALQRENLTTDQAAFSDFAFEFIDALFFPIDSARVSTSIEKQTFGAIQDGIEQNGIYGALASTFSTEFDGDLAKLDFNQTGDGVSYQMSFPDFGAIDLKTGDLSSEGSVTEINTPLMKSALLDLISSVMQSPEQANPEAIINLIRSLGGASIIASAQDFTLDSDILGPILAAEEVTYGARFNAQSNDSDQRTVGFTIGLSGLETIVPTTMAGIPADAVPTELHIGFDFNYQSFLTYVDAIGVDRIFGPLLAGEDPNDLIPQFLPEIISVYVQDPSSVDLSIQMAGQDYDLSIEGSATANMNMAGGPLPAVGSGNFRIKGFDGFLAALQNLAGEIENESVQSIILGGMLGAGLVQNYAERDGDDLVFVIQLGEDGSLLVNELPIPLPF